MVICVQSDFMLRDGTSPFTCKSLFLCVSQSVFLPTFFICLSILRRPVTAEETATERQLCLCTRDFSFCPSRTLSSFQVNFSDTSASCKKTLQMFTARKQCYCCSCSGFAKKALLYVFSSSPLALTVHIPGDQVWHMLMNASFIQKHDHLSPFSLMLSSNGC